MKTPKQVFKDLDYAFKPWPLKIKFILFFIKMKYIDSKDELIKYRMAYKILRGKYFIFSFYPLPPEHINCRCSIIKYLPKLNDLLDADIRYLRKTIGSLMWLDNLSYEHFEILRTQIIPNYEKAKKARGI